jgi:hypothetical protein
LERYKGINLGDSRSMFIPIVFQATTGIEQVRFFNMYLLSQLCMCSFIRA